MRATKKVGLLIGVCLALAMGMPRAQAAQVTATWVGGTGNWNTASNWSPAVVPNNNTPTGTTYSVLIDGGSGGVSNVTLNISVTIDALTVSSGDTLGIANGQSLVVATASTLSNAGTIALNSTGSSTDLRISGDVTLNGAGAVTMSNNSNNRFLGTGSQHLTNVNNTISGAGQLGANTLRLTNQGTILANASAGLTVDPTAISNVNSGVMRAESGGTLSFNGGAFDNTGGTIRANAGTVVLNNSAAITGGTVDVVGAGELRFNGGGSAVGGTLSNSATGIIRSQGSTNTIGGTVTNPAGGQFILDASTTLVLSGGVGNSYSNAGSIAMNSAGSSTDLKINADLSLTGGGTLVMSNNINNRIYGSITGSERLTNVDNTISGAGQIGANVMRLTNQGTILANASAGLTIDPSATGNFNSGTIRADGGNTLSFNSGAFDNTGGTIRANASTMIFNSSAAMTGGTVDVVGAGELRLNGGGSAVGGTLSNSASGIIRSQGGTNTIGGAVTNPAGGQVILDASTTLVLSGGVGNSYSNAGSITLNSTGSSTDLRISADVSLTGGGTLVMSNNANNRIFGNVTGTERLTNVDNTISGAGQIGANSMRLTNQGTILANATALLTIDPSATGNFNSGTIRADGGNTLSFNSGAFDNTGGTIRANASTVVFNSSAAMTGGTVDVVGAGELRFNGGGSAVGGTLSNSATGIIRSQGGTNAIGGVVSNPVGGQVILDNGSSLLLTGGGGNSYTNAGSIALNSTGSSTDLKISADVSLTGGGTLVMSNNANNRIFGNVSGLERLTNVNNTISGAGQIGANSIRLTNQGTILANATAGLTIDPASTGNLNSGTIRAEAGNTLSFNGGAFDNTGGTIRANAGTVIMNASANVTGGTVDVVGAGELRLVNGASAVGGTLTNSATGIIRSLGGTNTIGGTVSNPAGGQVILDNGTSLLLSSGAGNSYSNVGSIAMNSSGSSTDLKINGDVSLTGGGNLTMSNSASNRIFGSISGLERLTNVNNTISGAGQIGTGFMQFTNQGTLRADQVANLTIDITPSLTGFSNAGTVQVNAGSTLAMGSGDVFTQTAGIANINGTLTLTGGTTLALQGGTLSGEGVINDAINNTGGTVAPGNSPGILNLNSNYSQASGGSLNLELNGTTAGTGHDQLNVTGTVNLAGALNLLVGAGLLAAHNDVFVIVVNHFTDAVTGTFTGLPEGSLVVVGGRTFQISYVGGSGNDVTLTHLLQASINDVTVTEGDAGTLAATFNVSLSGASSQTVTVDFATANDTATAPGDYTALSGTLTFAPGETSKTVSVLVKGDTLDENNETFFVNLTNPANVVITDAQGLGTITDNDAPPTVSINDVTVTEGNTGTVNANFTVSLSAASGKTVTVQFASANGTAVAPGDYTAAALTTLTFAPGETTKTATVAVAGDTTDEANETFVVNLSSPTNSTIADAQGTGTINDDDAPPTISINDVTVTEGSSGTVNAVFNVTLSAVSGQTVTVQFATSNGTAVAPGDYTAAALTTLTFAPGETTKTVTIAVVGDSTDEVDETFNVNLSNPTNATIADALGVGTITDDDAAPSLTIGNRTVTEGNAGTVNAAFTVTLAPASGKTVTVQFASADGTAVAPGDYVAAALTTLTFAPGETTKTVNITVNGDTLDEANETYFVNLSNATNATIGDAQGQGTITDDDAAPTLSINDITVTEGNSGTVNATFSVTLSAVSGQTATVNFATANGTAVQPGDFTTASGTLTFAPGETTKTITVAVVGDTMDEADETLLVNLTSPVNATTADAQGTGTITDDDAAPTVATRNPQTQNEGSAAVPGSVSFAVELSAPSGKTVTVNFATANGVTNGALAGSDYNLTTGTVTFTPGQTLKTVNVPFVGDAVAEMNEAFFLDISAPTNATLGTPTRAKAFIRNDDGPGISIANAATVDEGNSGTVAQTFTVTLSAASTNTVTVNFATANGPASGGAGPADFTTTSGTLTFAPGQTSKTITILVKGDTVVEVNEKYFVNLSNPTFAIISDSQASGFIRNDDSLAGLATEEPSE